MLSSWKLKSKVKRISVMISMSQIKISASLTERQVQSLRHSALWLGQHAPKLSQCTSGREPHCCPSPHEGAYGLWRYLYTCVSVCGQGRWWDNKTQTDRQTWPARENSRRRWPRPRRRTKTHSEHYGEWALRSRTNTKLSSKWIKSQKQFFKNNIYENK